MMTVASRHIRQPGPVAVERLQYAAAAGAPFFFAVAAGRNFLEAVAEGFAAHGFAGGTAVLDGMKVGPFAYVMPALSQTDRHAAFYSERRDIDSVRFSAGAMTFGLRENRPFFHCHAYWTGPDGRSCGGHALPDGTFVAETFTVRAFGLEGAAFTVAADEETNFSLFVPAGSPVREGGEECRVFALRVRPNEDLCLALEDFCRRHSIHAARLHGGVGSLVGARFEDGGVVEPFATEVAITSGSLFTGAEGGRALIDIAVVDYTGAVHRGRLRRGDNPVLITMELVLEEL